MQTASNIRSVPRDAFHLPVDVAFLIDIGYRADFLAYAKEQAAAQGVTCHEWLIASGHISEARYYQALADAARLPFVDATRFDLGAETLSLLDPDRPLTFSALPLVASHRWLIAIAPRGVEVYRVFGLHDHPEIANIVVTTPSLARRAVLDRYAREIETIASGRLAAKHPELSARQTPRRVAKLAAGVAIISSMAIVASALIPGAGTLIAFGIILVSTLVFAAGLAVRLLTLSRPAFVEPPPLHEADLPTYTVLIPLYREATIVPQLLKALAALDYPQAKLEVIILTEADDPKTSDAVRQHGRAGRISLLVVPTGVPRTKPRALQFGLMFARGELLTIYDAEDVPEPNQLRRAAAALAADPNLSAVQATLVIDNARNWLTRQFALEYVGQFQAFLPGLAQFGLPILLGGTSNHFRTECLRKISGWDPWNVTEDADLGVRFAREGERIAALDSRTEEEAPATLRNWLGQRRRWMKGWLETCLSSFAQPVRLVRELGLIATLALIGNLLGTIAAALVYPFGWLLVIAHLWGVFSGAWSGSDVLSLVCIAVFVAGHFVPLALIAVGARRSQIALAWRDVITLPAYWCLVSFAAWGAVFALAIRPFHWVKTQHVGRMRLATSSEPVRVAYAASLPRGRGS